MFLIIPLWVSGDPDLSTAINTVVIVKFES